MDSLEVIRTKLCAAITYSVVREVSSLSYFYKAYLKGAIITESYNRRGITLNEAEYDYVYQKVSDALEVVYRDFNSSVSYTGG